MLRGNDCLEKSFTLVDRDSEGLRKNKKKTADNQFVQTNPNTNTTRQSNRNKRESSSRVRYEHYCFSTVCDRNRIRP